MDADKCVECDLEQSVFICVHQWLLKQMFSLVHFRRRPDGPPDVVAVPAIRVRNFGEAGDVAAWVALREQAMADQIPRVRTWSEDNFQSEVLSKPWWSAERS